MGATRRYLFGKEERDVFAGRRAAAVKQNPGFVPRIYIRRSEKRTGYHDLTASVFAYSCQNFVISKWAPRKKPSTTCKATRQASAISFVRYGLPYAEKSTAKFSARPRLPVTSRPSGQPLTAKATKRETTALQQFR
ncbi:hypothetical protein PAAG_05625 [Paracoccidioides lutzii Pb01]|uniref:Uncharacterized protein n=1 Tax=Paracoccidioides lutzii (strain ATCC MYA-826 / Pb01) TaxID=502779 RepID=C1H4D2_PARBA|nr:hypothetical protein PAAG_05625 [Paracoccidioides lutzii Pb01]EEH34576.2 hypothetical protein PAAG_05625 [Paracoccidioides lutzii Pb01]